MPAKTMALLLIPVLAVVLISGCVTGSSPGLGAGLAITDWKPDMTQVYSGDDVRLQLRLQNQGENRAENVRAELAGIDVSEWGTFSGFLQSQEVAATMLPVDTTSNTPGEVRTVEWRLQAPGLAKGTDFSYTPIVKVSYDYKTSAQKPITLVDVDELRRIQQQGKSLSSKPTTTSAGPLTVDIQTGNYVKTSDDFGTQYDIFPVYIKVTNTEWANGGTAVQQGFGFSEGDYPVQLSITPPSGTSFVYSGYGSDCSSMVDVNLWQGKDAEITCEFEVTNPPTFQQEKLIKVDLDYRFQTESSTSINVVGTEEAGFGFF
jgi:hypothetical protein